MSTILEHPTAQALLEQTDVAPETVNSCSRRLTTFIQRYLPCFYRKEQRCHADTILAANSPACNAKPPNRLPLRHTKNAGPCNSLSAPDCGVTTLSPPSCAATSTRRLLTPRAS